MRLNISSTVQDVGTEFPLSLSESFPPEPWNGDEVSYAEPVRISGNVAMVGEQVLLYGRVQTVLLAPCADCLEEARLPIDVKVEARFAREADPEDPDLWTYTGHVLELDDIARGAIFSHVPMRILCRPDCKGLCQHCGQNRNEADCACQKELPSKHPFSALASLLIQDEEV